MDGSKIIKTVQFVKKIYYNLLLKKLILYLFFIFYKKLILIIFNYSNIIIFNILIKLK